MYIRARGSFLKSLQALFRSVGHPDQTLIVHHIGEMQGLAAFTGAGIPPRLSSGGEGGEADELRREVLDLEFAFVEVRRAEEILFTFVAHGIRREFTEFTFTERFGKFAGLAGTGPEPERRQALDLAQVFGGDLHLLREPSRDRADGEGLGFDGLGVVFEASVQIEGVLGLGLFRCLGVYPIFPAEVGEDTLRNGATELGREILVGVKVAADRGIGWHLRRDVGQDAGDMVESGVVRHVLAPPRTLSSRSTNTENGRAWQSPGSKPLQF